jgi:peptidoglycan DL-endopeptidase CwlO
MRLALTLPLASALLCACATGRPLGAHRIDDGYRPFAAAPSAVVLPAVAGDVEPLEVSPGSRERVIGAARGLVGNTRIEVGGKRFADDCTGLVRAAYAALGVDLMSAGAPQDNGVTAIWRFTAKHGRLYDGGRPVPGDLVFFRETYDLNRDGAVNDGLTHIGLVDDVEADGTVLVIHRVARGVVRYRMNLATPSLARDGNGKVLNDGLRLPGAGSERKLTGELFVSFGTLLPNDGRLAAKR